MEESVVGCRLITGQIDRDPSCIDTIWVKAFKNTLQRSLVEISSLLNGLRKIWACGNIISRNPAVASV